MSMVSKFFATAIVFSFSINSYADTDYQPLGKPAGHLSDQAQFSMFFCPDFSV